MEGAFPAFSGKNDKIDKPENATFKKSVEAV